MVVGVDESDYVAVPKESYSGREAQRSTSDV